VEPDHDDTVRAVPRPPVTPRAVDLDDTVVRGRVAVPPIAPVAPPEGPPALVEPPAPEPRPLPVDIADVVIEPEPVVAAEPAPKPTFHVVLADGTRIALDTTLYVGRKPSIPRIHTGPAPRLVTLPSPGKELSATHLELKVVGGAVVATDMRSTNGTILRMPGAEPRTLIRGGSAVVVPGTRIDLGENAVLDVVAPGSRDSS
jgi:hypothetical protein